jgi:hypothetical protein
VSALPRIRRTARKTRDCEQFSAWFGGEDIQYRYPDGTACLGADKGTELGSPGWRIWKAFLPPRGQKMLVERILLPTVKRRATLAEKLCGKS